MASPYSVSTGTVGAGGALLLTLHGEGGDDACQHQDGNHGQKER